jgi:hypothetical protein
MKPPKKPTENSLLDFPQALAEVQRSLDLLKDRYGQVVRDQGLKGEFQAELAHLSKNHGQTPSIKAELDRIQQEIELLEVNLESRLFTWSHNLKRPFWQIVRFGGLGVIIGWLLKSWIK